MPDTAAPPDGASIAVDAQTYVVRAAACAR